MKTHVRLFLTLALGAVPAVSVSAATRNTSYNFGSRYRAPAQRPGGDYQASASAPRGGGTANTATPANAGWDDRHLISPRKDFQRKTGFPNGRPGYVVEYIVPLSQGGTDTMDNMRWTPVENLTGR